MRHLKTQQNISTLACLVLTALLWAAPSPFSAYADNTSQTAPKENRMSVIMTTSHGDIVIELDAEKAPITVENFLRYVDEGFFDGTIFHRVIPGFMIQGGGLTENLREKKGHAPIKNEADNGLKNLRGTLAMARTANIHSATSQFFINLADNAFLDHGARDFGYAVFGQVVGGMDVVDAIAAVQTGNRGMHQDVPVESVLIVKAVRKK